jgi:hypothetical protein
VKSFRFALAAALMTGLALVAVVGRLAPRCAAAPAPTIAASAVLALATGSPAPVTVADLERAVSDTRGDQLIATSNREKAEQVLADAKVAEQAAAVAVDTAQTRFTKALARTGPVQIGDTVYELDAGGKVRSFIPSPAETTVDLDLDDPTPPPAPDPAPAPAPDPTPAPDGPGL